jgi:hypothetical protein
MDGKSFTFEITLPIAWRHIVLSQRGRYQKSALTLRISYMYKMVQIWPGLFVCKQVTVCPGHIWTTLYFPFVNFFICICWEDSLLPVRIYCNSRVSPFLILFAFLFICYRFPWSGRFCLIDIVTVEPFALAHSGIESIHVSFSWRDLQRSFMNWLEKKIHFRFFVVSCWGFSVKYFFPLYVKQSN